MNWKIFTIGMTGVIIMLLIPYPGVAGAISMLMCSISYNIGKSEKE